MSYETDADSYDRIPYPFLTYSSTFPDRMAMLGTLLGMDPAPGDHCRLLDVGCAGGGNLFPMAFVLPQCEFVGIDFSARQIEEGREIVKKLGLKNVTLLHMDIMDMPEDFGTFDYIVAHGFYSWVPEAVRDRLLTVIRRHLAPQGVAQVSYNTLPGWHMLLIVRDAMLYHARNSTDPQEKARDAREMFTFLAKAIQPEDNNFGAFLHGYGTALEEKITKSPGGDNSLLLHDELGEINDPVYFHQFIEHAGRHGLQYLSEVDFAEVIPNRFSNEVIKDLQKMTGQVLETEQYMDFLKNKTFRQTLLCHVEVPIRRSLRPEAVYRFQLTSRAKPKSKKPRLQKKTVERFHAPDKAEFATDHPLTKAAFVYLSKVDPRAVPFDRLVSESAKLCRLAADADLEKESMILAANMLRAFSYSNNLIMFRLFAPHFITEISERPMVSPVARWQTGNAVYVTNVFHERVELEDLSRVIIGYLDGRHTHQQIHDALMEGYQEGGFKVRLKDRSDAPVDQVPELLVKDMQGRLEAIAQSALLLA